MKFDKEHTENYNRHNQNVIDTVPKEDLLGSAYTVLPRKFGTIFRNFISGVRN